MWNRQQLITFYTVQTMHTQSFTNPQFLNIGLRPSPTTPQFKETKHKFAPNCLTELAKLYTIQSIKGINGKQKTKG